VNANAMQIEFAKVKVAQYLSLGRSDAAGVYLNRLEFFDRMGIRDILQFVDNINPRELIKFEDSGKLYIYGYNKEDQKDVTLDGQTLEGCTYTVSIDGGREFNVLISRTEKNDIPYVCLGTKTDLELAGVPRNLLTGSNRLLMPDTNGNIWIRASSTNQQSARDMYKNDEFWDKFNFFK
jgi:hypothetical protein